MQLSKAEEQLIKILRTWGGVTSIEDIEEKNKRLKEEFGELSRYEAFMDNHPEHKIAIKSYSDEKFISFETNISKANMKKIAEFLMDENLAEQKAANETIQRYKGAVYGK